jgi:hypothetical protein
LAYSWQGRDTWGGASWANSEEKEEEEVRREVEEEERGHTQGNTTGKQSKEEEVQGGSTVPTSVLGTLQATSRRRHRGNGNTQVYRVH